MSQTISPRFCVQCGVKTSPEARFCVECGAPIAGAARAGTTGFPIGRYAPVIVLLLVVTAGAVTVWSGSRSAPPPAVIPPRPQGNARPPGNMPQGGQMQQAGQALPEGHPPLTLPDDVTQKIQQMAEAAKNKPEDLEVWRQLAMVQYRAGQFESRYLNDAEKSFAHVLEKEPNDLDALRGLGNVAYDREQPQEAIEYYKRYLTVKPDDRHVMTDLGTMYLSAKDLPKAIEVYEQVLAGDPKFFQAQFNLGIAKRALGDTAAAIDALKKSRDIAPDDATRKQVDDLLAHVNGGPPPQGGEEEVASAPEASGGQAAPAASGGGDAKSGMEAIFRNHPIVGSKLDRIEWPDPRTMKVIVRQFPMESMPPFAKDMFEERIKGGLKEQKAQHGIADEVRVDIVDAASGKTMDTITE